MKWIFGIMSVVHAIVGMIFFFNNIPMEGQVILGLLWLILFYVGGDNHGRR